VAGGHITHPAVAEAVDREYVPPEEALGQELEAGEPAAASRS